jgi:glycosyltransferase involved in cell wall biosynthesis
MAGSKRILLYYMSNKHSVPMETICRAVIDGGHELLVLTQCERGLFHEEVEKMGIKTYTYVLPRKPSWRYFLNHTRYLIKFCKKNKIETIWSHFPEANVIALLTRRVVKVKVAAFRHHDESAFYANYGKQFGMVRSKKEIMIDKFINRFANPLVVLSGHVLNTIKKYEHGDEKKIVVCPLIYDFPKYGSPDDLKVQTIKNKTQCQLRIIMVSRMSESKQHMPVFEVFYKLVKEGMSIKMIVMDDGPMRSNLENFIEQHHLHEYIEMPGFCDDVINYMASADILMHPSVTEASNNVVKEMGYMEKAVAVCSGVGDFDDYIENNSNGYLMERGELKTSIERVLRHAYANPGQLISMGKKLQEDVLRRFSDTTENRERFLQLV